MKSEIKLIGASRVFVCNEIFEIITNGGVAFETSLNGQNKIVEVGDYKNLNKKYSNAIFYQDRIILPAFVNAHVHFEFGSNISSFVYGGFDKWLQSVMSKRDDVLSDMDNSIESCIQEQLLSGVGSVGAISSYGQDMPILADSPLRVVFFNEAIGSTPSAIDFLYSNFLARYHTCKELSSERFIPAIALHSPYSVHGVLAKKVLEIAKKDHCPTSVHFLESGFEREWLEYSQGWFEEFYKNVLNINSPKPLYGIEEFLRLFEGLETLFVHCLFAEKKELTYIESQKSSVISCPKSNRLLNNTYLNLELLESVGLKPIFSTDGKSSNNNLNMLDELRCGLFGYPQREIQNLSQTLILGATSRAARALKLNVGVLEIGKYADISVFECPQISQSQQAPLQFLLQCNKVEALYIDGIPAIKDE